jgi:hypothetical protein
MLLRLASFCVGLLLAGPALAAAQDAAPATREEVLAQTRREKQASLTPYKPNALERGMRIAEQHAIPIMGRDGLYWKGGSLTTGSGFTYAGGWRNRRLFDRQGAVDFWAGRSLKGYWKVEGRFDMTDLANGRLVAGAYANHYSYPEEWFFGLGPDSNRQNATSFHLENTIVGGRAGVRATRMLTVGGGVEYSSPEVGPGHNRRLPNIGDFFDEPVAPGLSRSLDFVRTNAFLEFDYREPRNARRGGWYRMVASRYDESTDAYSFSRFDVDLRQFASILAERRVLAVRLAASTSTPEGDSRVPFYLMPTLGGHDSLRGFHDYRFRGPHAILGNAEYRFEIWSGLDAALFYDAGKVAMERKDLNFKNLEHDYGFGFRFNTDNGTILRIDAGFGSGEGKHLFIVFGDVF